MNFGTVVLRIHDFVVAWWRMFDVYCNAPH
jgi:hypothetical protein